MPDKHDETERVRLNEDAARRLIQRATELDASLSSQSSVAELREAARGAGISDEAFQRALDEVRASAALAPTVRIVYPVKSSRTVVATVMVVLIVLLVGLAAMVRTRPRQVDAVPQAPQQVAPTPAPAVAPPTPKVTTKKVKTTTKVPPGP